MSKSAFTLLETVIALGIVTVAIAAGVQANRALLQSGTISIERAQATMLMGDTVRLLEAADAKLEATPGGRLPWTSYLGITTSQTRKVVAFVTGGSPYSPELCLDTGITAGNGTVCSGVTTDITQPNSTVQTLADALSNVDGELIAISPLKPSQPIVDASTARLGLLSYDPQAIDYYRRKIVMTASTVVNGSQGIEARITVKNMRTGQSISRTLYFND